MSFSEEELIYGAVLGNIMALPLYLKKTTKRVFDPSIQTLRDDGQKTSQGGRAKQIFVRSSWMVARLFVCSYVLSKLIFIETGCCVVNPSCDIQHNLYSKIKLK